MAALLWGAAALQAARERRVLAAADAEPLLYVRSPEAMRRLTLSFDALAADIYWIRAIQYYGGMRLSDAPVKRYDLLYPLLDLTTSLDPAFTVAYRFGAFFLAEQAPGGAGRPDLAIGLLEKGWRANPGRWEYPHDIGFVHYRNGDYELAAKWFQEASAVPDAPNWIEPLVAVTLVRGGDRRTSRTLWEQILAGSDEGWLQAAARFRLRQLDALDQIDALEQVTRAYEQKTGAPPQQWEDLRRAGVLRGIPLDPEGVPYELNPWWGDVTLSPASPLWPLPMDEPAP